MLLRWNKTRLPCLLGVAAILVGCRSARTVRDPEYADLLGASTHALVSATAVVDAQLPVMVEGAGPHPVQHYVAVALAQNPRVQAARKRIEAQGHRVPQAASLEDPMVGVNGYPFFPYVLQTADGRATVNVMASQKVPWFGKLETQAQAAEAETDAARAQLAAMELEIIEQVKRAYYELHYVQKTIEITEQNRGLLLDFAEIAETKYRTGDVSQQDMLRAQVEVSNVDGELIRLRQQLQSSQARLAELLHASPETQVRAEETLADEQVPQDLERLYQQAIATRPELHAQLAEIRRDRHQADLARLQYYPDVTVEAMWGDMTTSRAVSPVAEGVPMVNIGAQINVPLYRKRLQAGVHEAESRAVASAREYDALKDRTQADVKDLFAQAMSQRDLAALFRKDIIPKSEQTLEVSVEAYRVGKTDFLQLIDNWRQLLQFRIALYRLESQLRQTLAMLERVVGGSLYSSEAAEPPPEPAPELPAEPLPAPSALPEGTARIGNE